MNPSTRIFLDAGEPLAAFGGVFDATGSQGPSSEATGAALLRRYGRVVAVFYGQNGQGSPSGEVAIKGSAIGSFVPTLAVPGASARVEAIADGGFAVVELDPAALAETNIQRVGVTINMDNGSANVVGVLLGLDRRHPSGPDADTSFVGVGAEVLVSKAVLG